MDVVETTLLVVVVVKPVLCLRRFLLFSRLYHISNLSTSLLIMYNSFITSPMMYKDNSINNLMGITIVLAL